jgi:RNA polymerase sigma-70 factor (ECF subfamily)
VQFTPSYRESLPGSAKEHTWQTFWLTTVVGRAPATLTEELSLSVAGIRQARCRVLRRLKQEMCELLS